MANIEMSVEDARYAQLIIRVHQEKISRKLTSLALAPSVRLSVDEAYYGEAVQKSDVEIIKAYEDVVEVVNRILQALDTD